MKFDHQLTHKNKKYYNKTQLSFSLSLTDLSHDLAFRRKLFMAALISFWRLNPYSATLESGNNQPCVSQSVTVGERFCPGSDQKFQDSLNESELASICVIGTKSAACTSSPLAQQSLFVIHGDHRSAPRHQPITPCQWCPAPKSSAGQRWDITAL